MVWPVTGANGQGRQLPSCLSQSVASKMKMMRQRILGIDFFVGKTEVAVQAALEGGLVVAPAAPALAELDSQPHYAKALHEADIVLADSGLMVLLCRLFKRIHLTRISGLRFLVALLEADDLPPAAEQFWIMPTVEESTANRAYLASRGIDLPESNIYIAPYYANNEALRDTALLARIRSQTPRLIMVNLAGGKQETIGAWLKQALDYKPGIICTGAAIAFLSGQQTRIGTWVDRCYLGWLQRIISRPRVYARRYLRALRLIRLLIIDRPGPLKP